MRAAPQTQTACPKPLCCPHGARCQSPVGSSLQEAVSAVPGWMSSSPHKYPPHGSTSQLLSVSRANVNPHTPHSVSGPQRLAASNKQRCQHPHTCVLGQWGGLLLISKGIKHISWRSGHAQNSVGNAGPARRSAVDRQPRPAASGPRWLCIRAVHSRAGKHICWTLPSEQACNASAHLCRSKLCRWGSSGGRTDT